ncbi:MAG: hypothetical protein ACC654_03345 [Acidimicrobiia bacterium]
MNDGINLLDRYIGSPIYGIAPEHGVAIVLVVVLAIGSLLIRFFANRGHGRSQALRERYRALTSTHRLFFWLLSVSAVSSLGMALGRMASPASLWLFVVAGAQLAVVRRLLQGKSWRRLASYVLVSVLTVNLGLAVAGITVDQVGLITALLQATALAVVFRSVDGGRVRRFAASATVIGAIGFTTLAGWGGAVVAGIGGENLGDTPLPAVLLPVGTDREPTAFERAEADRIQRETAAAIEKYKDVGVAAAAGYDVRNIAGSQYHAENARYKSDGVILDPQRPETLVYEPGPNGPVLIGALFEMESIGISGPAFGGPITVWHAHDHICFAFTPPAIAGFESPLGVCPVASISVPVTNEMIHVWTMPGVDDPYSELDEDWLADYVASVSLSQG